MNHGNKSQRRLAPAVSILGAVFAAAAFLCAIPFCRNHIGHWLPALAYCGVVAALAWVSTKRPRNVTRYCLILAGFALVLRLAWALYASFPPLGDDYEHYRSVSLDLLRGEWDELFQTFWPWGYFLYLTGLAWLFGSSLMVPVTANAVIGTATTLLVYALARRYYGESTARIAAAIYALWPGVLYWNSVLCSEIPHLFFFLGALLCLLKGLEAENRRAPWLLAGGVLAALAEFIRPLSPLLLLPFACYAFSHSLPPSISAAPSRQRRRWLDPVLALGAYVVCLAVLLTVESVAVGYPNFGTSHTMGINLAFGLNWESQGMFNLEDAQYLESEDPREANRRGMELALKRLKAIWGSEWWRLPILAYWKFRENWSMEATGLAATYDALPEDGRADHWLTRYEEDLSALAQFCHAAIMGLAAVGFWRDRRRGSLALLAGILLAFVLLHVFFEADSRYHFGAQSLLAVAAAGAFAPFHRIPRPDSGPCADA